jgi:hypothetical protein
VVDFNLTAPSPASITVPPSNVSGPVSFDVTGQGAFEDTVNLSCGNLPSGASCNFLPSGSVNPTSTTPVAITLTVEGTFPITINGSGTNGPTKTRSLSLTITLEYSVVISNPALQAYMNSAVNFNGVLTSVNGYNSGVNLSGGAGAPPACSAAPALVVPTTSAAPFIVTVGSPACGSYNFNIVAAGTDAQKTSHLFFGNIHRKFLYDVELHSGRHSGFPEASSFGLLASRSTWVSFGHPHERDARAYTLLGLSVYLVGSSLGVLIEGALTND